MQYETHLIGESGTATGAVGGKLGLVQLDQVLRLAAGAVEALIQPPRGAAADVGCRIASNSDPLLECAPWGGRIEQLELTTPAGFPEDGSHDEASIAQRSVQATGS